jgi:hypothetical protein
MAPARLHAQVEAELLEAKRNLAASQDRVSAAARQLGTELREIRRTVERIRAVRPHPIYPGGFRFPAYRWDEYDELLALEAPALYEVVERAYVAAHNTNEVLRIRSERIVRKDVGLGETPDDGLDAVYELAGEALDALAEPHGEPWETGAQRAVRLVTEDILQEAAERSKDSQGGG